MEVWTRVEKTSPTVQAIYEERGDSLMDKKPSVTRREFVKGSILTSTGMLVPGIAQAASQEGRFRFRSDGFR
jgi:hypothetical protein